MIPTKRLSSRDANTNPRKKRRLQDARYISTQAQQCENPAEGSLNLESFVESRKFETKSFISAMNTSKQKSSQRAFQTVPRELRRRTASHNANRVPKRLRLRASREMAENNTPRVTPHRRKLSFRLRYRKTTSSLAKGTKLNVGKDQLCAPKARNIRNSGCSGNAKRTSKQWLPTHLWAAKRSHMVSRWGFSMCDTPVVKCWRSTYRASELDGCVVWDTSYTSTFTLEGSQPHIRKALEAVLPSKDPAYALKGVVVGGQSTTTWAFKRRSWPLEPLAPVTIFWRDIGEEEDKGKDSPASNRDALRARKVVVRVHPHAFKVVWEEFQKVVQDDKLDCLLTDVSAEIGSIQLAGPLASSVLVKVIPSFYEQLPLYHPELPCLPSRKALHGFTKYSVLLPRKHGQVIQDHHSKGALRGSTGKIDGSRGGVVPVTAFPSPISDSFPADIANTKYTRKYRDCWTILLPWKYVLPVWISITRTPGVRFGGLCEMDHVSLLRREPLFPVDFDVDAHGRTSDLSGPKSSPCVILPPALVQVFLNSSSESLLNAIRCAYCLVNLDFTNGGVPSAGASLFRGSSHNIADENHDTVKPKASSPDELIGYVIRGGLDIKLGRGAGFGAILWQVVKRSKKAGDSDVSDRCIVNTKNKKRHVARWTVI